MSTQFSINTPAAVSSLTIHAAHVILGSDDGTVRIYHVSTGSKVVKAIRGLGCEVSSVVCTNKGPLTAWIGCGRKALAFPLDGTDKMVLSISDASSEVQLGGKDDEEDVLNELAINAGDKHLAFSLDSGFVGVMDLSNRRVSRMKVAHTSICGTVKFVPDRYELVSGGYDFALLHFDSQQGTVLSRFDMVAHLPSSEMSLSPPFILSTSMSPTGILAAGTADGRIWIGSAGEKRANAVGGKAKKRSRKWEGLSEQGTQVKVAEGPIVSLAFVEANVLVSCTLLGSVTAHQLSRGAEDQLVVTMRWTKEVEGLAKVNAMAASGVWIAVGGFTTEGKGFAHVWPIVDSNE